MMPYYQLGSFDYATAMALATLLGVGFGFALERGGFGRSTILSAQFYGRDMRVLKVMFSAIVTAAVGLGLFHGLGLLDLAALKFPETFVGPHLVGGLLLGVGFIVAGYCPGTSVVATASGNVDGLITFAGVGLGSLVFAWAWPLVEPFYDSGAMGVRTLPAVLGLPWTVVAAAVVIMAVLVFVGAEKIEAWLAGRDHESSTRSSPAIFRGASIALGSVAALALALSARDSRAGEAPVPAAVAEADLLRLGQWLVEGPSSAWIVDARRPRQCQQSRIPGALCLAEGQTPGELIAGLPPTRPLLVYGDSGYLRLDIPRQTYGAPIFRLAGGYTAFAQLKEQAPPAPQKVSQHSLARHARLNALHAWLNGVKVAAAPLKIKPRRVERAARKGGGC